MRTTINLDEEALGKAMEFAPGKTKTALVNEALREYAKRRRLASFASLFGKLEWEGDLDELRGRVPKPK